MQFQAFEEGIEVNGQTVYAIVDGFVNFKSVAVKFLMENGVGVKEDGSFELIPDEWYSQEAWLRAFKSISEKVGGLMLYQIGLKIPANAIFPPWVRDVMTAIQSIDIAYHLNHRKRGQVLFDMNNGKILEGIGHYGYEKVPNKNQIISVCENPYPCEFDRGIITTMAKKFEKKAEVIHDNSEPCRKKGADSCTYLVTW